MRVAFVFFQPVFQVNDPGHPYFLQRRGNKRINACIGRKRKSKIISLFYQPVSVNHEQRRGLHDFAVIYFKGLVISVGAFWRKTNAFKLAADIFHRLLFSGASGAAAF